MNDEAKQDPLFEAVENFVLNNRTSSVALVQRTFMIGYNRAASILEALQVKIGSRMDGPGVQSQNTERALKIAINENEVIKVIGVGGCGIEAINYMIMHGMQGVEFAAIDTDTSALSHGMAATQLLIDKTLLQASETEATNATTKHRDCASILPLFDGVGLVIIVAGIGGYSGSKLAPLVAQIAYQLNILTVAVISKPLETNNYGMDCLDAEFNALAECVDSWISVPSTELLKLNAIEVTDPEVLPLEYMHRAVAGIADVITKDGLINVDIDSVASIMSAAGRCMMGTAFAAGISRASIATELALSSLSRDCSDMAKVRNLMVNITSTSLLKLKDIAEVLEHVQSSAPHAVVIVGSVFDETMAENLRVTIFILNS